MTTTEDEVKKYCTSLQFGLEGDVYTIKDSELTDKHEADVAELQALITALTERVEALEKLHETTEGAENAESSEETV